MIQISTNNNCRRWKNILPKSRVFPLSPIMSAVCNSLFLPGMYNLLEHKIYQSVFFSACLILLTSSASATYTNNTASDRESGSRRFSFSTVKLSELKTVGGEPCQEIGRSGAEKSEKKNVVPSVSRSIADGATRSVSATKKKSAKNVKRKSNKKKGGNDGSGVRSRVHLSAVSDRVNSRKLINHTRGSK